MEAPASQFKLLTRGLLPGDQSLDKVVSAATYALVTKRVSDLGMPIEPLKRFKPWMLAITLEELEWQKAGFDASLGLDRHFYDRAKVDGKSVQGLETVDFQLSLFDKLTTEEQDRMLAESLKDVDKEQASVLTLTNAWRAGDAAAVERIVLDDLKDDAIMYDRLLVNRNRKLAADARGLVLHPKRPRFRRRRRRAHLVGPDGTCWRCSRRKGYKVEQL